MPTKTETLAETLDKLGEKIQALGHAPTTADISEMMTLHAEARALAGPLASKPDAPAHPIVKPPDEPKPEPREPPRSPPRSQPKNGPSSATVKSAPAKAKAKAKPYFPKSTPAAPAPKGKPYKWPKTRK